eukprot:TRINITY_DN2855_c0_g2_i2.p1 TRINITY_DN2855_c0_g2~~TRINITY_DN2855_c0_g2_i2.p1  ORF type:complete len:1326 (+),score=340.45 TRINITY_DN2855_c0_g2_i2:81-4058(+)
MRMVSAVAAALPPPVTPPIDTRRLPPPPSSAESTPPQPPSVPSLPLALPSKRSRFCPNCGTEAHPGGVFCHNCGTRHCEPPRPPPLPALPLPVAMPLPGATQVPTPVPRRPPHAALPVASPLPARPEKPALGAGPSGFTRVPRKGQQDGKAQRAEAPREQRAPRKTSVAGPRATAPWLEFAGLPDDGSIDCAQELGVFADFVSGTAGERSLRAGVRAAVQKITQTVVPESTVKIIGGWATGVASFESPLDLVIEHTTGESTVLVHVAAALESSGLIIRRSAGWIEFDGCALSKQNQQKAPFDVRVHAAVAGGRLRQSTNAVATLLRQHQNLRAALIAIRCVMRRLAPPQGAPSGHCITLMALAHFDHCRRSPSYADPGWVFREFFRFYANFDFGKDAVCVVAPPGASAGFVPRAQVYDGSADHLVVPDPTQPLSNAGAGANSSLLVSLLKYSTMLVQRYDFNSRGCSLLPNLIPVSAPWLQSRSEWLRKAAGSGDITKRLAVNVAEGMADWLISRSNRERQDVLRIAAWDTLQGMVREAKGDVRRCRSASPRVRTSEAVMKHAEALDLLRGMHKLVTGPGGDSVCAEVRAAASEEGADLCRIAALMISRAPTDSAVGSLRGSRCPHRLVAGLARFQDDDLAKPVIMDIIREVLGSVGLVDILEEVLAFLEDPANATEKQTVMREARQASGWGGWGSSASVASETIVFERIARESRGPLRVFRSHSKLLVGAVQALHTHPAVHRLFNRAAAAAVTPDLALAIATEVADFLENSATPSMKEDLMRSALNDSSSNLLDTHTRLFSAIAECSGEASLVRVYRDLVPDVMAILDSYAPQHPAIDHQRRRAARAAVNSDAVALLLRNVSGFLDNGEASAETDGAAPAAGTALPDKLFSRLERAVSMVVFARLAETDQVPADGRMMDLFEGRGPRRVLEALKAFRDEPEIVELRRRVAAACALGNEDPTPPDLVSSAASSPRAATPAEPAASSCLGRLPVAPFPEPEAVQNLSHSADVPRHFFSLPDGVRARQVAQPVVIPVRLCDVLALLMKRGGLVEAAHLHRGNTDIEVGEWELEPGCWGGVRKVEHTAETALGRLRVSEGQRFLLTADGQSTPQLSLQCSAQVPGVALVGGSFRAETHLDFTPAGVGGQSVQLRVGYNVRQSQSLGVVAAIVSPHAAAAAAATAQAFTHVLTEQCPPQELVSPPPPRGALVRGESAPRPVSPTLGETTPPCAPLGRASTDRSIVTVPSAGAASGDASMGTAKADTCGGGRDEPMFNDAAADETGSDGSVDAILAAPFVRVCDVRRVFSAPEKGAWQAMLAQEQSSRAH